MVIYPASLLVGFERKMLGSEQTGRPVEVLSLINNTRNSWHIIAEYRANTQPGIFGGSHAKSVLSIMISI